MRLFPSSLDHNSLRFLMSRHSHSLHMPYVSLLLKISFPSGLSWYSQNVELDFFQQEMTVWLKRIFRWNGKPPDSTWSLLVKKRVGGQNDSLLNNSIADTMNKTCERPCWCHCRLQFEIGNVGSRCVKHFEREWGVINNGQGAAVRTAGETRAVKMAFYPESEVSGAEELSKMFWHPICFCKMENKDCARGEACGCVALLPSCKQGSASLCKTQRDNISQQDGKDVERGKFSCSAHFTINF